MKTYETEIAQKVQALGESIQKKLIELHRDGILHGEERLRAVELQVRCARLDTLARERLAGSVNAERDAVLAGEMTAIRTSFERWIAQIDRGF